MTKYARAPQTSSLTYLSTNTISTLSSSSKPTLISSIFQAKFMIKIWSATGPNDMDQLTPRAGPNGQELPNPFDIARCVPPSPGHHTPTLYHHHLLNTHHISNTPPATNGMADLTHSGPPSPLIGTFAAAIPTTHLSLHAPDFNTMSQSPSGLQQSLSAHTAVLSQPTTVASSSSIPAPAPGTTSKGQIHVKLIQARGLNVRSVNARPYVVVQFEQNEFVSRDPTAETDKEVKGTPTNLSRTSSSNALSALGAINSKAVAESNKRKNSPNVSPSSSLSSGKSSIAGSPSNGASRGLFGTRLSAHNPVWKHEVSFDVTSEQSVITFNVYDREVMDQGFLGTIQIKPVLEHDHTVDQWYKLRPYENEVVSGEMRVQITFEQDKTKSALTPRDFEFLKLIGRGTFGKVFQVRKKDTKRIYAMKILSKKEIVAKKEVAHTIGERKILQRSLESPFLVGLKFGFQTDTDLYLVTDFKSGGELFWHLQKETRFTEERAKFYIAELILALEHLHKFNIVYRDLKPENILLDATGHVALCDFGLSKADLRPDELTTTFCGTTEYLAPEVLLDEQGYSKLVDFWSLGVLLFEMCCGWSPFYAEDTQQMYKNICFGKIRFPKGVINEDGKQFVKGLLNRNPKHRLGALRDAEELKEHPFFKSIDWKALSLKQVTPPFKPVVESDESTNNFDPEFTSADLRDVGVEDMDFDEEDTSEDWVAQSISGTALAHQPNGPLGSDRVTSPTLAVKIPQASRPQGIQIKKPKKSKDPVGTPLTNSVQEHFKGFTYSGGESLVTPVGVFSKNGKGAEEDTVTDDDAPEVTTEDEFEDVGKAAGRYANLRRKGLAMTSMDGA